MNLLPLGGDLIEYRSEPRRNTYTLTRSIVVQDIKTGAIYGVPAGFECDGASIPWFLPETGACEAGGFGHDFAYRFGGVFLWDAVGRWVFKRVTRAWADDFYAALCRAYGSARVWSGTQWATLRLWPGTWLIWARHRRRNLLWTGNAPSSTFIPASEGGA